MVKKQLDIVVVGAGHAGCEAAAAAARLGKRVAMLSLKADQIGRLSCNPAIGGLAKGNLVRELDALGGLMAKVADASTIQFRVLNTRKGLAVRSSRAQVDIDVYPQKMRETLSGIDTLEFIEGEAVSILHSDRQVYGVALGDGTVLETPIVILTTGTFLGGLLHCGSSQQVGGRVGEEAAHALSDSLRDIGLRLGRLKTGTTPRLNGQSIDWSKLEPQGSVQGQFSFDPPGEPLGEILCYIAHTHEGTHQIIRENIEKSAVYGGQIEGTGPRYCPSIEDKVVRFPQRDRHLLFLEPEGLQTNRIYVNGLSTSLPPEVQEEMVRSLPGLEQAEILQYGYAVEYDFSDPRDLGHDLQHQALRGLYLAGQVNGTSGYEEAAAQGFVAGVSAATGKAFRLGREEAYIGVLIDDLVTRGVGGEPYRMFTSRAEHRLLLREDNADRRLMPKGRELGLVDDESWARFQAREQAIQAAKEQLGQKVSPNKTQLQIFEEHRLGPLKKPSSLTEILRRPEVRYSMLQPLFGLPELSEQEVEQVETDIKYEGYLERERARAEQVRKLSGVSLAKVPFARVPGLSSEAIERLQNHLPETLASASRLPGITPAAITALAVFLSHEGRSDGV
ncbi:MAG: tRNA uridine-5-carboxymethylaminomethyl(34) synthesis enzyme MnmG [Myxococcota bacterium]|nr:tRNA uridine-5-carboxymethylaminomethyl(34) synthesis enzyme MnmG [Myxococcota bacterium]